MFSLEFLAICASFAGAICAIVAWYYALKLGYYLIKKLKE